MELKRAREIAASPMMKNVTLNGEKIYIDGIAEDNTNAYVHPINRPQQKQKVSIENLIEQ